ncbi:NACHT domain-containing protein [Sphingomonas faeni]|uniref:NACHT domain-containing protein n=1 Tax=Sphingomonas faeni TaxID=185950 RepID=UPI003348B601
MKPRWSKFEDQVREIASLLYGRPCAPGRVAGNDIDGIVQIDETQWVLIEITINFTLQKVRDDLGKLLLARSALFQKGILSRGVVVVNEKPTNAMLEGAKENNFSIVSHDELAAEFFEYPRYSFARKQYPFGSSINPENGEIDQTAYVPVYYRNEKTGKEVSIAQISEGLLEGRNYVILGEYGSGKSRCVSEVFGYLADKWGESFLFPIAINLRECWGLESGDEAIRRHFNKLGLDQMAGSAIRAYNRHSILFLLDGFDEIGTQSWSVDDARLKQLRAQALLSARDIVRNAGRGVLVTGRDHYFSTDSEMLTAHGLDETKTVIIRVKEEFSVKEMLSYFAATKVSVALPEWLPRRPLICHTIAQLNEEERDEIFGAGDNEAIFWNHFIKILCKRDARINASFDADTIFQVFLSLALTTRTKPGDVGPISQRELQEAFEAVVGQLPVEDAAVMLQRLPSLGRVSSDTSDRQFIDTYILDGLRAHQIDQVVKADEDTKRSISRAIWTNSLQPLGQKVLASLAGTAPGGYLNLAKLAASDKNKVLAGDIVASLIKLRGSGLDFEGYILNDASVSELDFVGSNPTNLEITNSTIEQVILPSSPPKGVRLHGNIISRVAGASSVAGLGDWIASNEVEHFDSVKNTSRIRDAELSPAAEFLATVVKKTFFQPGTGRKEAALTRGLSGNLLNKVAPRVLNILLSEGTISSFKGDEGKVYIPNRSQTSRMEKMLSELKSSSDTIWLEVAKL